MQIVRTFLVLPRCHVTSLFDLGKHRNCDHETLPQHISNQICTDHDVVAKPKFTLTECLIAITGSVILVIVMAVLLVNRIEDVVEAGIPDQFLGLILLPLVEKAAEHLSR